MPARKPDHLKAIQGTYRKDRAARKPVKPKAGKKCPTPPTWLSKDAKKHWKRIAPDLYRRGLLDLLDIESLGMACACWAMAVEASRILEREGHTNHDPNQGDRVRKHPAWQIFREAQESYRHWASRFGLTPSDRGKVEPLDEEEKPKGFAAL